MKLMYLFDNKIKPYLSRGKKYCNPAPTGVLSDGISCIKESDVNIWFYTKDGVSIAVDSGHLNFPNIHARFDKIGINPNNIRHVFITHADVDHCGGIDSTGTNIFPNAQVYLGSGEEAYLNGSIYRIKKFGIKIKNCVQLDKGYKKLEDREIVTTGTIKVQAFHIPGHTIGHMCYIVDDFILFSGDCLAVNDEGGYSFFDFFTQYPDMNKRSLIKLKNIVRDRHIKYVCTGHSGIRTDIEKAFSHIDKSATFSKKHPFDENAPWDFTDDNL